MPSAPPDLPRIGVVVVTFNSADVILDCLDSLFGSRGAEPVVVVVDNASTDGTVERIARWADGKPVPLAVETPGGGAARTGLTVVRSPVNGGYAHGCNLGLEPLLARADLDAFWILNPDCVAAPDTAAAYLVAAAHGPYALLGSRTLYRDQPGRIQSDGGIVSRRTAVCRSINSGCLAAATPLPAADAVDYISGANLVASRAFIERAGLMHEGYFLYYEEVDWAFARGDLPIRLVPGTAVYHIGGTVIGSAGLDRLPSAFAVYFNCRNRIRFARRRLPGRAGGAVCFNLAKALQYLCKGAPALCTAALRATLGLGPPAAVRARIGDPAARRLAFGPP